MVSPSQVRGQYACNGSPVKCGAAAPHFTGDATTVGTCVGSERRGQSVRGGSNGVGNLRLGQRLLPGEATGDRAVGSGQA